MRTVLLLLAATICGLSTTNLVAATRTKFDGQMFSLSEQVADTLTNDPRLKGHSVTLGEFIGEGEATGTNFGLRIEKALRENLNKHLEAKSKFTLAGSYLFVTSEDPATPRAKVLVITAQIKDERGREVKPISVEINDTDGIAQALGLTGSIPQTTKTTFEERNDAMQKAQEKPAFGIIDGTWVTAVNEQKLAMGILKKHTFDGATSPVSPDNVDGKAFVSIGLGDYFEIELVNTDTIDVVATLTVDGLDVANTFATDKDSAGNPVNWPGYLIPAGHTMVVRGWLNTIDQSVHDNVYSFRVVELGQGAASALKARGGIGVITVQFRQAFAPGTVPRGVETAKGEGLQEKMEAKPVQIGDNVLSTVSIRYNRSRE